jgi:hypothetical protein
MSTENAITTSTTTPSSLGMYDVNIKGSYKTELDNRVARVFRENWPLITALAIISLPVFFVAIPIAYFMYQDVITNEKMDLDNEISLKKESILQEMSNLLPSDYKKYYELRDTENYAESLFEAAKEKLPDTKRIIKSSISKENKKSILDDICKLKYGNEKNKLNSCSEESIITQQGVIEITKEETESFKEIICECNKNENLDYLISQLDEDINKTIENEKTLPTASSKDQVLINDFARNIYPVTAFFGLEKAELINKKRSEIIHKTIQENSKEKEKLSMERSKLRLENHKLSGFSRSNTTRIEANNKKIEELENRINKCESEITIHMDEYINCIVNFSNKVSKEQGLDDENSNLLQRILLSSLVQTFSNISMGYISSFILYTQSNNLNIIPPTFAVASSFASNMNTKEQLGERDFPAVFFYYDKDSKKIEIKYENNIEFHVKKILTTEIVQGLSISANPEITINLQDLKNPSYTVDEILINTKEQKSQASENEPSDSDLTPTHTSEKSTSPEQSS